MKTRGRCLAIGKNGWKRAGTSCWVSRRGRKRCRHRGFTQLEISQTPIVLVEDYRTTQPRHLSCPRRHFGRIHERYSLGIEAVEERLLAFRRPTGTGSVLDMVDAHWLREDLLFHARVVRCIAEDRVDVEGIEVEFRIPAQIDPMFAGH